MLPISRLSLWFETFVNMFLVLYFVFEYIYMLIYYYYLSLGNKLVTDRWQPDLCTNIWADACKIYELLLNSATCSQVPLGVLKLEGNVISFSEEVGVWETQQKVMTSSISVENLESHNSTKSDDVINLNREPEV